MLEDLPAQPQGDRPERDPFGELGRIWFGGAGGLRAYARSDLDADAQALVTRLLDLLRRDAVSVLAYRSAAREGSSTRERFDHVARLERSLRRALATLRDPAQSLADLSDRLAPHGTERSIQLSDVFVVPPSKTSPTVLSGAPSP